MNFSHFQFYTRILEKYTPLEAKSTGLRAASLFATPTSPSPQGYEGAGPSSSDWNRQVWIYSIHVHMKVKSYPISSSHSQKLIPISGFWCQLFEEKELQERWRSVSLEEKLEFISCAVLKTKFNCFLSCPWKSWRQLRISECRRYWLIAWK